MKYFILNADQHENFDFTGSSNESDTVRWNNDRTQFITKFEDDNAPDLENPLTADEVREIINNPDNGWISQYD